jgi:GH15 family glucan-1,4-alpha-glucosidase
MSQSYPPIGDYGVIGDCRSAALISRTGSLDWLCWPRFDSPSIFAALLDAEKGGRFAIRPRGDFRTERRYLPDTNILETTFHAADGTCVLRDLMPVSSEEEKRGVLTPAHEVLREVACVAGEVEIEVSYEPRPRYALAQPPLERRGALGIWLECRAFALVLRSEIPLTVSPDGCAASGTAVLRAGESCSLSLSYAQEPAVLPILGPDTAVRIERSARWWRSWTGQCTYEGPYRDMVVRSALLLKLLAYAPSGAVVAAPTTSLPEWIGGVRNWDYRYCWLRDASFTLRALLDLGFEEEAAAFMGWTLHATHLTRPDLRIIYNVFGETHLPERTLDHLEGYRGSRPVRIGNDARHQLQLDVYGEVVDAAARFAYEDVEFDRDTRHLLRDIGETVCRCWRDPDEGIWEPRAGRAHHTHSKALCWVALDRLLAMHRRGTIEINYARYSAERDAIRAAIEAHGYNHELQSYTEVFDGSEVGASLLVLPLYGYTHSHHPRMRSTLTRIHQRLARGNLIYRYPREVDDGLPPGEGAFGICSFWAAECHARVGAVGEASDAFEDLLGYANDLGLYGEEIDPDTGAALGNFPQGFTHVGLINAALTIAECEGLEPGSQEPELEQASSPGTTHRALPGGEAEEG